ncbi:hypothetical protein PY254_10600 [Rhodanobacter sp. AS-Z3]|uniref:hypothetical protein n=1 Tax=Rhodanobacter sp. AS-Z3 TaxID=3031330 RepID=UPI002479C9F2|nr:hypothetical protein [Rhodanobacter sp. AS-Z3]WEN13696.1 hypothetical protein PY254_10600 [Rhodanobacter sp. AS-Z3]
MGNALVATASRTWTIIQALAVQLATITVANGYLTDVGNNVWTTDNQRTDTDALGLMIYSESITGAGLDLERPGKGVRDFGLLVEAAIGTDIDDAQQQIHSIIEDIDNCMIAYGRLLQKSPNLQQASVHVADIAILDRPEGMAVVIMQARIVTRYFR